MIAQVVQHSYAKRSSITACTLQGQGVEKTMAVSLNLNLLETIAAQDRLKSFG